MTRAAVYPVTTHNSYLVEMLSLYRKDIQITSVIVPMAYKDRISIPKDIYVFHKMEESFSMIECMIFLSSWEDDDLYSRMAASIQAGKSIICAVKIPSEKIKMLTDMAQEMNVTFQTFDSVGLFDKLEKRGDPYTMQESAIVAVGALTKGISSSEAVSKLSRELVRCGYRVCTVVSDPDLRVLDFQWLPIDKLITNNLDHTIVQVNRFFNYIQLKYRPDVIVIQLPDEGVCRVSNVFETCFGAETYLISQAVDIDYCVMLSPLIGFETEEYNVLSDISKYRYGFIYNSIYITQNILDMSVAPGTVEINYYKASAENIQQTIKHLQDSKESHMLYVSYNDECYFAMADDIIRSLS